MHPTLLVTHHQRLGPGQRQAQITKTQGFLRPKWRARSALPSQYLAVGLDAPQGLGITIEALVPLSGSAPSHAAIGTIDTSHGSLECTHTHRVAHATGSGHQIDQAFDLVGASGTAHQCFPANTARCGVQRCQTPAPTHQQLVTKRHQQTGLAQHQGVTWALLRPELLARGTVKSAHGSVTCQNKYTGACHQWGGVGQSR